MPGKRGTGVSKLMLPDQVDAKQPSSLDVSNPPVSVEDKTFQPLTVPVLSPPPDGNPLLEQKLSFSSCLPTDKELAFPKYLNFHGILEMITYALVRLERENPRPPDPWQWLAPRIFLGKYNPDDKEKFMQTKNELLEKRQKLLTEQDEIKISKKKSTSAPHKLDGERK